jgi:hypothetical protein
MTAIPAPAERTYIGSGLDWDALQPDYKSFSRSFFAFHEMLGLAYYKLHYRHAKAAD